MPKIFGRTVSPVMLVAAGAAVAYLGFTGFFPEEAPVTRTVTKKPKVSVTAKNIAYTDDDRTLKFAAYSTPVKNTFKPLIVKQDSSARAAAAANPGGVPPDWTGGGNWVYSGRVVVDGVSQALLENRATGDAEFLLTGQRWRQARVIEITSESLTLGGPNNAQITLIAGASEPNSSDTVTAPSGVAPVTVGPGLAGQIGGNVAVQPTEDLNSNNRPRRRARRNQNNETQGMEE